MLVRSGIPPGCASAMDNIRAKPQAWEKAVRTKALARRDPMPPALVIKRPMAPGIQGAEGSPHAHEVLKFRRRPRIGLRMPPGCRVMPARTPDRPAAVLLYRDRFPIMSRTIQSGDFCAADFGVLGKVSVGFS